MEIASIAEKHLYIYGNKYGPMCYFLRRVDKWYIFHIFFQVIGSTWRQKWGYFENSIKTNQMIYNFVIFLLMGNIEQNFEERTFYCHLSVSFIKKKRCLFMRIWLFPKNIKSISTTNLFTHHKWSSRVHGIKAIYISLYTDNVLRILFWNKIDELFTVTTSHGRLSIYRLKPGS